MLKGRQATEPKDHSVMHLFVPDTVPSNKHEVLRSAVEALASVTGVVAVVLGGSYARGTHHAHSDLDLGVYYSESCPFSIDAIRTIATQLSHNTSPVVTDFYEWGPFTLRPPEYKKKATRVLAHPGETVEQLSATVASLEAIWQEVVSLAGDSYKPKYLLR